MAENEFQAEPPDPARRRARQPEDGDRPLPPERRPTRRPRDDDYDDDYDDGRRGGGGDDAVAAIIPYKNPLALISYYCGVFGLIPCVGLVLGPAALVLGILGLRYSRRHQTARGGGHAITGIVLGVLSLYNWGVVVAMVVVALLDRRAVR